jgi:hypothetical protein
MLLAKHVLSHSRATTRPPLQLLLSSVPFSSLIPTEMVALPQTSFSPSSFSSWREERDIPTTQPIFLFLLVEDDSNDSKVLVEQQLRLTSYQWQSVCLSEKERECSMRSQSSYSMDSLIQRNVLLNCPDQPPPVPGVSKTVIWWVSIALGPYFSSYLCASRPYISLILDPIALPPSPTSPSSTQASSTAPMLSMAKRIMHRHVRVGHFRFPFVNPTHITLSHCFFPDDTLNPPCIIVSPAPASTHIRRCVNLRPS